jgi:hypothetical protein
MRAAVAPVEFPGQIDVTVPGQAARVLAVRAGQGIPPGVSTDAIERRARDAVAISGVLEVHQIALSPHRERQGHDRRLHHQAV